MTQLVKNNTAVFAYYRNQQIFYSIVYNGDTYHFPITVDSTDENYDIGNATLNLTEKAMTLMRYMRKAIAAGTFVKVADGAENICIIRHIEEGKPDFKELGAVDFVD